MISTTIPIAKHQTSRSIKSIKTKNPQYNNIEDLK